MYYHGACRAVARFQPRKAVRNEAEAPDWGLKEEA